MRSLTLLLCLTAKFLDAFWNRCGASTYDAIGLCNYSPQNEWINSDDAGCTPADSETGTVSGSTYIYCTPCQTVNYSDTILKGFFNQIFHFNWTTFVKHSNYKWLGDCITYIRGGLYIPKAVGIIYNSRVAV